MNPSTPSAEAARVRTLEWCNSRIEDRIRNTRQNVLVLAGAMLLIWTAIIQIPLPSPAQDQHGADKVRTYSQRWQGLIVTQSCFAAVSIAISIFAYMTSGSQFVPPDTGRFPERCPHCKKSVPLEQVPAREYDQRHYEDLLETQLADLRRTALRHKRQTLWAAFLGGFAILVAGVIAVHWACYGPVP